MKKNVGTIDKVIRILMAVVAIALYLTGVISGTIAIVMLLIAALLVVTSYLSFCPIYWPFSISTRSSEG